MVTIASLSLRSVLAASALFLLTAGNPAWADPPGRVARVSYIRGDVGFQPGGSGEWADAVINRPLVTGDRLATDRDGRVELEIGAGSIRLDERTTFSLLDINDAITQVELTDGTLNLDVRRLLEGQSYEVDTPTLAFVVSQPGEYRIDVGPNGDSTMVTVFRGSGDVYGENNASYRVRGGQSYRFSDARLRDYEVLDVPSVDDFDRFCQERNDRYERAVSSRYVSDEVVGYADLDDYGSWSTVASYGSVWYPRGLRSDWAPYRDGHWAWIDPWGWSWVDDQPWGFAPSHYGRWANINSRWAWVPGPRQLRPVYAPALVAFVGGNNWGVSIGSNPVGWFPLGPRDVYRPWYDSSRDYFTRVNTHNTIINNITVVNVYNDYSRGRPSRGDYAYRRDQRAFTAVPGNVFAGARPVGRSRLRLNQDAIGRGNVVNAVAITPVQASLAARGNGRVHRPDPERFDRAVVARNAPPAQVLPFAQREGIIRDNGNRSPGMDKLRGRARSTMAPEDRRIRVVDADNQATPRDIPVDANRAGLNRDGLGGKGSNRVERRAEAGVERADRAGVNRGGGLRGDDRVDVADRASGAAKDDAGQRQDRRVDRERLRANTDARDEAGSADQRLPSTRYSPTMRNRPIDDSARRDVVEQRQTQREQAADDNKTRNAQRRQNAQQDREDTAERSDSDREQALRTREQRARLTSPDATDPPERFQPQAQRQQRDVPVERQANPPNRNAIREQRAEQAQQRRDQQVDAIQLPPQQNNRQVERMQVQEQQRAERSNRMQVQQEQPNQQVERMQVQEQQRADQSNRHQAQQVQRQQEQKVRQAQMQQRQQDVQVQQVQQQAQMQQRQQQAEQVQVQSQQQVQQQQDQQQQPATAQDQRKQRQQQRREANEAKDKEDQQNR